MDSTEYFFNLMFSEEDEHQTIQFRNKGEEPNLGNSSSMKS
jgi:hypothetical protein